jgi:hypothetical protein
VKIWAVPSAIPLTTAILPFLPGKVARAGSCANTTSATPAAASDAATNINTPTDDGRGNLNLVDLDAFTALLLAWRSAREGGTVRLHTPLVTAAAYRGGEWGTWAERHISRLASGLFTEVRGREILRTSAHTCSRSRNFGFTAF